jgi:hypothetical protein
VTNLVPYGVVAATTRSYSQEVTLLAVITWIAITAALVLFPRLLVDLLINPDRLFRWAGKSWHGNQERRPEVAGPPVEKLAAEIRRLARVLVDPGPVSSVRRFGVERAYDESLGKACSALGIEHHLNEVPLGDLEFERLRVEAALEHAGLVLRDASCGQLPRRRHDGLA